MTHALLSAFVIPYTLAAMIHQCAPHVQTGVMSSIIQQESTLSPWAIRDDSADRSYYPQSAFGPRGGIAIATYLAAQGHTIDIGYAGIDSVNFLQRGMSVQQIESAVTAVFDPLDSRGPGCGNLTRGERILQEKYVAALQAGYRPGRDALTVALFWYNGGAPSSWGYARTIIARAQSYEIALPMPDAPWPSRAAAVPVTLPATEPLTAPAALPYTTRASTTFRPGGQATTDTADRYSAALRALRAKQTRDRLRAAQEIRAQLSHLTTHTGNRSHRR